MFLVSKGVSDDVIKRCFFNSSRVIYNQNYTILIFFTESLTFALDW